MVKRLKQALAPLSSDVRRDIYIFIAEFRPFRVRLGFSRSQPYLWRDVSAAFRLHRALRFIHRTGGWKPAPMLHYAHGIDRWDDCDHEGKRVMSKWLSPRKVLDYHVVRRFEDVAEAERQLYLAVVRGDVRVRLNGKVLGPEWLKQLCR